MRSRPVSRPGITWNHGPTWSGIRATRPNQAWAARTVSTTLARDGLDQALHAPQAGHGLI